MPAILKYSKEFFDIKYAGEQVLIIGNFFKDILHSIHGAISIAPFACMPMKVVEAILSKEATMETKEKIEKNKNIKNKKYQNIINLPFLPIESDGNPFPQIVEARIEAFCLQVERIHGKMTLD